MSPTKETIRIVPCNNCGEEMSLTHLCLEEGTSVEDQHGIGGNNGDAGLEVEDGVSESEGDECDCTSECTIVLESDRYCCKNTDCDHPDDCECKTKPCRCCQPGK